MNRSVRIILMLVVAVGLVVPAASAKWYSRGDSEPNTPWDQQQGQLWLDPPSDADDVNLVYFNGFTENGVIGVNPNVGANVAGFGSTRVAAYWSAIPRVMLGVWKDCNQDGYMGMAETAVVDYRSELLLAPNTNGVTPGNAVCPVETRDIQKDWPVHNDGQWVKEFLALGMVDPCEYYDGVTRSQRCTNPQTGTPAAFTRNPDVFYTNETRVWMDVSKPGTGSGTTACPFGVPPRGMSASTGGLINYFDCFIGRKFATTVNIVDSEDKHGLKFDDPRKPQTSDSKLNQQLPVHPWGDPYTGDSGLLQSYDPTSDQYEYQPMFTVSDCTQTRKDVRDPTAPENSNGTLNQIGVKDTTWNSATGVKWPLLLRNSQGYMVASVNLTDNKGVIFGYYGIAPKAGTLDGSAWAGVEDAYDGFYVPSNDNYQAKRAGDCDRSTNNTRHDDWEDFLEGDNNIGSGDAQFENSMPMTFFDGGRGVGGDDVYKATNNQTKYWPADLGVNNRGTFAGPAWGGGGTAGYVQFINRNTLEFHPAFYRVYYAYVPAANFTAYGMVVPPASGGVYGADACPAGFGPGKGAPNGFECDPAKWWLDPAGKDSMPYYSDTKAKLAKGAKPGEAYSFRDVDCYDGHIGQGIYANGAMVQPAGRICAGSI